MPRKAPKESPQAQATEPTIEQRRAQIAAMLKLENLPDYERSFLATCQRLYRQSRGCSTPFEEFFTNLVRQVEFEDGPLPTPEYVADKLEVFRQNWEDMKHEVIQFLEAYPEKETTNA